MRRSTSQMGDLLSQAKSVLSIHFRISTTNHLPKLLGPNESAQEEQLRIKKE